MKNFKKFSIVFLTGMLCLTMLCRNSFANSYETIMSFNEWTDKVFSNESYDVVDVNGKSCKENFIQDNKEYYKNGQYNNILNFFQNNNLRYSFEGVEKKLRDTNTRTPYKLFYHNGKNSECSFEATVKLSITIRVDDNTGVIRSYEGPYLTLFSLDTAVQKGEMKDINTNAQYSSSKRTITATGSYSIVLYPAGIHGLADQVFGRYTDSFVAG